MKPPTVNTIRCEIAHQVRIGHSYPEAVAILIRFYGSAKLAIQIVEVAQTLPTYFAV